MAARIKIDREEFTRLNEDGWTIPELSDHFNAHPKSIGRLRKTLGIKADKRRLMTPERKAAIQSMLDDGWSFAEIHRTEGAHPETLRKHFPGMAWTGRQRVEHQTALRLVDTPTYADGLTVLGIKDIVTSHLASERKAQREYRAKRKAA